MASGWLDDHQLDEGHYFPISVLILKTV